MKTIKLSVLTIAILMLSYASGAVPSFGLERLVAISQVVAIVSVDAASKAQDQKAEMRVQYQATVLQSMKGKKGRSEPLCFETSIGLGVGEKALVFLRRSDIRHIQPEETVTKDALCKQPFDLEAGFGLDALSRRLYGGDYLRVPATAMKLIAPQVGATLPVKEVSYSTDGLLHASEVSIEDDRIVVEYLIDIGDLTSAIAELAEIRRR